MVSLGITRTSFIGARHAASGLLMAGVLGLAPRAHAQTATDKATAEALFVEAKRLMGEKKFAEACPKLADSAKLDPGVGTSLNLALCYKQNGQTASAWTTYREAAAQARTAQQLDREELARNEAAALEKTLTRLVIQVSPEVAAIQGLEIKRDGSLVPSGLWGVAAPVDPGVRGIDVTAPGKKPLHLEVKAEGAGATAQLVIPALESDAAGAPVAPVAAVAAAPAPAPTPAATPAPPPAEAKSGGNGQFIAGIVVAGVGAAGLVTGTIFGLLSIAQGKAADQAADNAEAHPEDEEYYQDRKQGFEDDSDGSRTIAFVSLGVGAACAIGGLVLIGTAPKAKEKASLELLPELGKDQVGLRLSGTF